MCSGAIKCTLYTSAIKAMKPQGKKTFETNCKGREHQTDTHTHTHTHKDIVVTRMNWPGG